MFIDVFIVIKIESFIYSTIQTYIVTWKHVFILNVKSANASTAIIYVQCTFWFIVDDWVCIKTRKTSNLRKCTFILKTFNHISTVTIIWIIKRSITTSKPCFDVPFKVKFTVILNLPNTYSAFVAFKKFHYYYFT